MLTTYQNKAMQAKGRHKWVDVTGGGDNRRQFMCQHCHTRRLGEALIPWQLVDGSVLKVTQGTRT